MTNSTITILGASGMLGSIVTDVFAKEEFSVIATVRDEALASVMKKHYPSLKVVVLDAEKATQSTIARTLGKSQWVINAIGIIKPYIHDDNPEETERAIRVNALFPHTLAKAADMTGAEVIQIATDCVYSGKKGNYTEDDPHDALDVYGKTKSLGEAFLPRVHHLRCSIIGPEPKGKVSLLEWFLKQPSDGQVNGFTNHNWNGVTTLHFGRLCLGIIKGELTLPHIQHVIPSDMITKADLLKCFAKEFNRDGITINPVEAPNIIDRTLATTNEALNKKLWQAAGYKTPPTITQMVHELAQYNFQLNL